MSSSRQYHLYLANIDPNLSPRPPEDCPANAVVLYPAAILDLTALENNYRTSAIKYDAYFVQEGQWLKENKELQKTSIGSYQLDFNKESSIGLLPETNHNLNIIKTALARARLRMSPLLSLPEELLLDQTYPNLRLREKHAFTLVSTMSYGLFKRQLTADELLQYVLDGAEKSAKKILEVKPESLFTKGSAENFYGQPINDKTPFEAALGADDFSMLEMMKPFIAKNPKEAVRQFCVLFPESHPDFVEGIQENKIKELKGSDEFEKLLKKEVKEDSFELAMIVKAISEEKFDRPCHILSTTTPPEENKLPLGVQAAYIYCGEALFYGNQETKEFSKLSLLPPVSVFDCDPGSFTLATIFDYDPGVSSFLHIKKPESTPRVLNLVELGVISMKTGSIHEKISAATAQALQKFRVKLKPQDTIRQGNRFNYIAQMLCHALETCIQQVPFWNERQVSLFLRQILGQIERFLPVNYVRSFVDAEVSESSLEARLVGGPTWTHAQKKEMFFTPGLGSNSFVYPVKDYLDGHSGEVVIGQGRMPATFSSGIFFLKICETNIKHRHSFKNWLRDENLKDKKLGIAYR